MGLAVEAAAAQIGVSPTKTEATMTTYERPTAALFLPEAPHWQSVAMEHSDAAALLAQRHSVDRAAQREMGR